MIARHRVLLAGVLALAACRDEPARVQGYVEGDYLRIGLPAAGQVTGVAVGRGDAVAAGADLFTLDDRAERAALDEAQARLEQARGQRDNLLTGRRVLELRALEASRAQAVADLRLAELTLTRQESLVRSGTAPQSALDRARADLDRGRARVAELSAQLAFAREGGRHAEIAAAQAAVTAAEAAVEQARVRLDQRVGRAPEAGRVEDVLARPGEILAAGQPAISLLPVGNVTVRLFLSPDQVGRVRAGARLGVACTGCPTGLAATVGFVAREASFAPPVLYAREAHDKLVFLVEARPEGSAAAALRPGQPVSVTLPPAGEGG